MIDLSILFNIFVIGGFFILVMYGFWYKLIFKRIIMRDPPLWSPPDEDREEDE